MFFPATLHQHFFLVLYCPFSLSTFSSVCLTCWTAFHRFAAPCSPSSFLLLFHFAAEMIGPSATQRVLLAGNGKGDIATKLPAALASDEACQRLPHHSNGLHAHVQHRHASPNWVFAAVIRCCSGCQEVILVAALEQCDEPNLNADVGQPMVRSFILAARQRRLRQDYTRDKTTDDLELRCMSWAETAETQHPRRLQQASLSRNCRRRSEECWSAKRRMGSA